MMRNRLLGVSAISEPTGAVTGFDMSGLVRRLLLFDKYIVVSIRLLEFRHLAEHLGYERTRDLLGSGLIEIRNECVQMSEVGTSGLFGAPKQPPMHYQFNWLDFHDRKATTSVQLDELRGIPGISEKENIKLRGQIVRLIHPLPHEAKAIFGTSFFTELYNDVVVKEAVKTAIRQLGMAAPADFALSIERQAADVIRVETDLAKSHGFSLEVAHRACQHALLGVSALTQQIGEMKYYGALSGFRDDEAPLFRTKMSDLFAAQLSSGELEQDFQRVLEVSHLPEYNYDQPLDIERLLRVRDTSEIRVFRDWLQHGGAKSDAEISELTAGYKNVLGLVLNDKFGKGLRFLFTTAMGLAPTIGIWAGPAASAIDLALGELFQRPGVTAFIDELYPSLFQER
jgi:hypothetical protein